jgi:hypothetical protein
MRLTKRRAREARGHCAGVVDIAGRIAYGEGSRSKPTSENAPYT